MKKFLIDNGLVQVINIPEGLIGDTLPVGIYTVKLSKSGYYLSFTKDRFDEPNKLYGSTPKRAERIKKVYKQSSESTGVLLTGLKGAGKSNLMKHTANSMLDDGYPVIIVQDAFQDSGFMEFINDLGECVILFDEFGKTYLMDNQDGINEQHSLLTFFDGVYSSKCLLILAENKTRDVDNLFLERPSRVLFHWSYDRLEEDVVEGYCKDNLITKEYLTNIMGVYYTSAEFTFDSLKTIVSQCNMFDGDEFEDIIDGLNIPLKKTIDKDIVSCSMNNKIVDYNLIGFYPDRIDIEVQVETENDDWDGMYHTHIYDRDIKSIVGGITTYETNIGSHGIAVIQVKDNNAKYDYNAY